MATSASVMLTFLVYSIAMFVLPVVTFFTVRNVLEKNFHITGFPNMAWSVICAVIVVNVIIMAYAWTAFKHEQEEEEKKHRQTIPNIGRGIPASKETDLVVKKDE